MCLGLSSFRDPEKVIALKIRRKGASLGGQWIRLCSQCRDPGFVGEVRSHRLGLSLSSAATEPTGPRATRAACRNEDPVQPEEENQEEKVNF